MTVNDIIDGARGLDPSFTRRAHPNRLCREFLTRYQQVLMGKMLQVESESVSQSHTIPLPLATFADGAALESAPAVPLQYDKLHGAVVVRSNDDEEPLHIVPFQARFQEERWPFGWIRENRLYLGGFEAWWSQYTSILVEYAPTPGALANGAAVLLVPDSAWNVMVLALGAELAKRIPDPVSRKTLPSEAFEAEVDYLNLIEERNDAEVGTVRRVFS